MRMNALRTVALASILIVSDVVAERIGEERRSDTSEGRPPDEAPDRPAGREAGEIDPGRFTPSERIPADTSVPFPADI